MGAFISNLTLQAHIQQSLNSNSVCLWNLFCNYHFLSFIMIWNCSLTVSACFSSAVPAHWNTRTQSTLATCFLIDSVSIGVRLTFTPGESYLCANVLLQYIHSLLCYLSRAFIFFCCSQCMSWTHLGQLVTTNASNFKLLWTLTNLRSCKKVYMIQN